MHRSRRIELALFLAISIVALVPRLAVVANDHRALDSDERTYDKYAWSFALDEPRTEKGKEIYHPLGSFTYRPPGYPLFVGLMYRLVEHDPWPVRLAQAVLGALSAGLVYAIGRELLGRRGALLAGSIVAASPMLIRLAGWLLSETLFTFLMLLGLWALMVAPRSGRWSALLAGLAFGASAITRPVGLPLAVAAPAWLILARLPARMRWRQALLTSVGAALVIAPIMVKNYQIHGQPVLISTHGGITFWRGLLKAGATGDPQLAGLQDRINDAGLGELEQEETYYRVSLDYLRQHPGEIPVLLRRKAEQFLLYVDDEYEIAHKPMPVPLDPVFWRMLLLAGALGFTIFPRRRFRERLLLGGALLVQIAVTLVFDTTVRYRAPLVPLLALSSAVAIAWLGQRLWEAARGVGARSPAA